jgi:hypothetical protein
MPPLLPNIFVTWSFLSRATTLSLVYWWNTTSFSTGNLEGSSCLCSPVRGDRCTVRCAAYMNFADESLFLMADNVWNEGKLLNSWTAWRHYVSRPAMRFMRDNLFMICQQWADLLADCSQLQLGSSVLHHGAVNFRAMGVSVWHLWLEKKQMRQICIYLPAFIGVWNTYRNMLRCAAVYTFGFHPKFLI